MSEDFLSGDLVIFGCIGNLKIKGSNKITCTADGTWSAPVPECIGEWECIGELSELWVDYYTPLSWLDHSLIGLEFYGLFPTTERLDLFGLPQTTDKPQLVLNGTF